MGAIDPDTEATFPVAVFTAQPGKTYTITPHVTYYVASGSFEPGQIIDVTQITDPVEVDFTNKKDLGATVTHDENGNFTVKFTPKF
jgi:hypothetical protein